MPAESGFPHSATRSAQRSVLRSSLQHTPAAAQLLAADAPLWLDTEPPAVPPVQARAESRTDRLTENRAAARQAAAPAPMPESWQLHAARAEPQVDPLAPALPWLVRHLGVAAAVEAAVGPLQGGPGLDAQHLLPLLRRLGVDLRSDGRPLQALGPQDCPAVLLLRSGDTCVLTGCDGAPGPQRRWQLVVPQPQPLAFSVTEDELAPELVGMALVLHRPAPAPAGPRRSDLRLRAELQAGRAGPDARPLAALAAAMQLRTEAAQPVPPPGHWGRLADPVIHTAARIKRWLNAAFKPGLQTRMQTPIQGRIKASVAVRGSALRRRLSGALPKGLSLPRLFASRRPRPGPGPAAGRLVTAAQPSAATFSSPTAPPARAWRRAISRLHQAAVGLVPRLASVARLFELFQPGSLTGLLLFGARPFERLVRQPLLLLCGLLCQALGLPVSMWAPMLTAGGLQALGLLAPGLARRAFPDEQAQAEAVVRREQRRRERARRERELALAQARTEAQARRRAAAMAPFAPVLPEPSAATRQALRRGQGLVAGSSLAASTAGLAPRLGTVTAQA